MDENEQNPMSPEELNAEEEATKEVHEDDLRSKLAEDFGLNPEDESQQALLDKLVLREKSNHERLSTAIKQKRSWRDKAKGTPEKPKAANSKQTKEPEDLDLKVSQKVSEILENRDLESLELPDELKTEVKELAKLRSISVREASKLPYITARKEEIERSKRLIDASPKRSKQGSVPEGIDYSKPLNPKDFYDANGVMDTKAWKEARAMREKHKRGEL